ncbi:MAG: polysaccharide deacetylase family protein [Mycobacteriales bacterium]
MAEGRADQEVDRRAVLGWGMVGGVAGLAGLASWGEHSGGHPQAAAAAHGGHRPAGQPGGDTLPKPGPEPTPSLPPLVPRTKPVFSLSDILPQVPPNAIALTIDDGPSPQWTPKVLDLLARHKVKATFCLVGSQIKGHPSLAREIVDAGHHICNHTYTHPQPFAKLTADKVREEILRTTDEVYRATGVVPRLFRSPGGDWSPAVFSTVAEHGLTPIDWNDDPKDWSRPGVATITQKLLAGRAGDILLCHDGGGDRSQTVLALTTVIPTLLGRGLQFVTL